MEITQSRVVIRARDFDLTSRFYEQVLAFPRLANWHSAAGRSVRFQAGGLVIEILGRPRAEENNGRDESFDYVGPSQKMVLEILVPSAEETYEELVFRDRNIPGGLRRDPDGSTVFETHDPDGVRIAFRQLR